MARPVLQLAATPGWLASYPTCGFATDHALARRPLGALRGGRHLPQNRKIMSISLAAGLEHQEWLGHKTVMHQHGQYL